MPPVLTARKDKSCNALPACLAKVAVKADGIAGDGLKCAVTNGRVYAESSR